MKCIGSILCVKVMLFSFCSGSLSGQGVYIGIQDTVPAQGALLELESSSQGLLLPRMTSTEMEAISNPVMGLMVFNTSANIICYYNGSEWRGQDGTKANLQVGDYYQGGVVIEVDATGRHGLIAATEDITGTGVAYGCQGTSVGATSSSDGNSNTTAIIIGCATAGIAADLCDSYSVVEGGVTYDDWYLPSTDELTTLWNSRNLVGGFTLGIFYWTSTEIDANQAQAHYWASNTIETKNKGDTNSLAFGVSGPYEHVVRPIRAF